MLKFFCGWRRKVGIVTLVTACAVMGLWARSQATSDTVRFAVLERSHSLTSAHGRISWNAASSAAAQEFYGSSRPFFRSEPLDSPVRLRWFQYWTTTPREYYSRYKGANYREWRILHLCVVIPLTIVSAYLLVVPLRKRRPGLREDAPGPATRRNRLPFEGPLDAENRGLEAHATARGGVARELMGESGK